MVSLTCETTRDGGVTLVTAQVTNSDRRRRVRLEHDADGAVWPPRTDGVPAAGWDGATFECVLAAGERRAVGYATPAPVEDPLTVVTTEPVDGDPVADPAEPTGPTDGVPTVADDPAGVIRALGSPVPPRDAVPDADPPAARSRETEGSDSSVEQDTVDATDAATASVGPDPTAVDVETAVDEWLSGIERRLAAAEELSASASVRTATPVVRELGGLAGVRDVAADRDAEADRLREVAERATALADRAESVTLPVETLERLG